MESDQQAANLSRPAWKDILYGSTAGMAAKFFEHPFDLVKVRLQSQPWVNDRPTQFNGPVDCFVKTLRGEGFRGLYRGLSMPVGGAMAENATLFVAYNQTQRLLSQLFPYNAISKSTPVSHLIVAGAVAGLAVSYVLTPVELVKCRMQVQMLAPEFATGSLKPPGPARITLQILKEAGLKGLWLGQTGTLIREIGGSVAWFLTYEMACRQLLKVRHTQSSSKADLSPLELMSSGAAAGIAYSLSLFPADTVKSTIQTAQELKKTVPKSFVQTGLEIYRQKGIRGLYQGCATTCVRSSGSSAIIFCIYGLLEKKFG